MGIGIGFQRMFGVRDQARTVSRFDSQMGGGCPLILTEMDMDDMFWEIPTQEVFKAVEWAIKNVKGGGGQVFFSLAEGNMRQIDWLGASSSKSFTVLCSTKVLLLLIEPFVKFDVTECNLLVLGNLILKQGRKGVPIEGFLSTQLAELWALWREYANLSGDSCDQTATLMNEQVKANPRDESTINLLPPLAFWPSLSLTGDSDFTLGLSESQHMNYMVGMVRSPNIAQVTPAQRH